MTPLGVSVVVNTLNRADSFRRTLSALQRLAYPALEVVVVAGPSDDQTDTVLAEFAETIKVARCEVANLSVSRNIGIRESSGELVAFIDDDAVPDPWWLDDIVPAFDDYEVAAAGGPIYDFDGRLFSTHAIADAHGDASIHTGGPNPTHLLAAPCSDLTVSPIGTNSVFRRAVLVEAGGFDEEFGNYFDETEVCRRLTQRGWVVEARPSGFVQHLREPSAVRTADRVLHDVYPILRNRLYFALQHARGRDGLLEVMRRFEQAVDRFRADRRFAVENGLLSPDALGMFELDVRRAVDDAFESARLGPHTRPATWFGGSTVRFRPLGRSLPSGRLHICIVSHEYPPKPLNGVGRYSHQLAVSLAARGHIVRVLTGVTTHDGVSLEDDVWVHRVVPHPAMPAKGIDAPSWVWDFSARALEELKRIDCDHAIDVVHLPNWNAEGIAVIEDGQLPTVLGLHTPITAIARIEPSIAALAGDVRRFAELERRCYEGADNFVAWGPASLSQVESDYGIVLPPEKVCFIPHGIADVRSTDPLAPFDRVNVLFVGRLESRKGADTLLAAIAILLPAVSDASFTLIGNDTIRNDDGRTYREQFELMTDASLRDGRVAFLGVVSDEELGRYYAGCDVFVAPSRHESFGLTLLEAMREGKPVIAGDVGGMREIVEHEQNGLLVSPTNADELANAIRRLVESPADRKRFGRRSRELFLEKYTSDCMATSYEAYYQGLAAGRSRR
jgi:glycosyltransferase involved in cell wall biosynthesis